MDGINGLRGRESACSCSSRDGDGDGDGDENGELKKPTVGKFEVRRMWRLCVCRTVTDSFLSSPSGNDGAGEVGAGARALK